MNYKNFTIKETPVLLTIIFDLLTGGIYSCAWFLVRRESFNKVSGARVGAGQIGKNVFIYCLLILIYNRIILTLVYQGYLQGDSKIAMWTYIFDLIVWITLAVQSFDVKDILERYIAKPPRSFSLLSIMPLSGGATFFFRIYYLQYVVNKIHNSAPKNKEPEKIITRSLETTQTKTVEKDNPCNAVKNYDQLMKLKSLHNEGVLTEGEYLAEKNKLL